MANFPPSSISQGAALTGELPVAEHYVGGIPADPRLYKRAGRA